MGKGNRTRPPRTGITKNELGGGSVGRMEGGSR